MVTNWLLKTLSRFFLFFFLRSQQTIGSFNAASCFIIDSPSDNQYQKRYRKPALIVALKHCRAWRGGGGLGGSRRGGCGWLSYQGTLRWWWWQWSSDDWEVQSKCKWTLQLRPPFWDINGCSGASKKEARNCRKIWKSTRNPRDKQHAPQFVFSTSAFSLFYLFMYLFIFVLFCPMLQYDGNKWLLIW